LAELFRPSEHEPLAGEEWSEERAEEAIAAIVADAEAAFDGARWPWHPRDDADYGFSDLYLGGAGMIWALAELGSTGWVDVAPSFIDHFRVQPEVDEPLVPTSFHFGELGITLVAFRLTRDAGLADRVHELVRAGIDSDANEVMYGAPGSLLAADAMLAWTGDERWGEVWCEIADGVEGARDADGLWTSRIVDQEFRYLGPAHGYAGNTRALANRRPVEVDTVLERYALREGPLVNWPPGENARPDEIRVQWCHGAAGIVSALGDVMDEELALAGGELTWHAGPIAKGPGLCHGTAGNAYAFLVLHRRTGDERWLERARAFGMHAIGQVERERATLGRGRYSLFTGDIGVALFLRHLLDGSDRFPTMGPF
jgi:hypothetical protein